jgi:cardiolipin synthase
VHDEGVNHLELPGAPDVYAAVELGVHRLALLRDGEQAFPAMLAAIARARSTICLETYILRDDGVGRRFADALAAAARRGVEVSLLFDAWGSSVSVRFLERLREAGVRVLAYRPLSLAGPRSRPLLARLGRRDHKKSLVVDHELAFTGGINLCDDHAPRSEGGAAWRDTHLAIEGPAAVELQYFFLRTWRREGGAPLDDARYAHEGRRPDGRVHILVSDLRGGRLSIRRAYHAAIRGARSRISITNAYFLPTIRLLRALTAAARRGVEVRVVVPGESDVLAVRLASRSIYGRLLRAGVRIFEFGGRVLHAKTAVVDGRWATVGSSNLDSQSLRRNLEANAIVEDERFAGALERMFEEDLAASVEVTTSAWRQRGLAERAGSWLAYLAKDWL